MQISSIPKIQTSRLLSTTTSLRFLRNNHNTNNCNVAHRPFSASKGSGGKSMKRPSIKTAGVGRVEGVWYTTLGSRSSLDMGRYGLKRLDYKTLDPPAWTVPPHPPTKLIEEKVMFPLTLVIVVGFGVWAYMNHPEDEDMKDYWKRVETGQILVDEEEDNEWDQEEE
jgi:hypothetical protein